MDSSNPEALPIFCCKKRSARAISLACSCSVRFTQKRNSRGVVPRPVVTPGCFLLFRGHLIIVLLANSSLERKLTERGLLKCQITHHGQPPKRRDARAAEWTGLENRVGATSTGVFKSPLSAAHSIPLSSIPFNDSCHTRYSVWYIHMVFAIIIFLICPKTGRIQCGRNFSFSVANHNLAFSLATENSLFVLTRDLRNLISLALRSPRKVRSSFLSSFFLLLPLPFPTDH